MLFQLNAIKELNFRKVLRERAYVSGRCKSGPWHHSFPTQRRFDLRQFPTPDSRER
jgi:hypothetical protein